MKTNRRQFLASAGPLGTFMILPRRRRFANSAAANARLRPERLLGW